MTDKIKVDVAVNVYGKPYQTVLSILSLLKYSKNHIDKIYIITEKNQPFGFEKSIIKELLNGLPVIFYTPKLYFANSIFLGIQFDINMLGKNLLLNICLSYIMIWFFIRI